MNEIPPIKREAKMIFPKEEVMFLKPQLPTLSLNETIRSPLPMIAATLVARAKPPIPRYLEKTILSKMFIVKEMHALIIGVFVSCKE